MGVEIGELPTLFAEGLVNVEKPRLLVDGRPSSASATASSSQLAGAASHDATAAAAAMSSVRRRELSAILEWARAIEEDAGMDDGDKTDPCHVWGKMHADVCEVLRAVWKALARTGDCPW